MVVVDGSPTAAVVFGIAKHLLRVLAQHAPPQVERGDSVQGVPAGADPERHGLRACVGQSGDNMVGVLAEHDFAGVRLVTVVPALAGLVVVRVCRGDDARDHRLSRE